WRKRLSLPPQRPVILFGGGHYTIVPHEPHWLTQLDQAIGSGEIPGRPLILFRRHPVDPFERWREVLGNARNIFYDDPWPIGKNVGRTNIEQEDIDKLTSSLFPSSVHINASSSLTIDGAIFDRPQIGPAYDDR